MTDDELARARALAERADLAEELDVYKRVLGDNELYCIEQTAAREVAEARVSQAQLSLAEALTALVLALEREARLREALLYAAEEDGDADA